MLKRFISFSHLLFGFSCIYLLLFFPRTYQILGFVAYSYLIYYLFGFRLAKINRLYPLVLLALPMLLLKFHFKIDWLGFAGLSYITFRTIQILLDTQPTDSRISPVNYFSFLTFTPTLLIGPIDRSDRFLKNLQEGYQNLNANLCYEGWQNFSLGILQKYILAELVTRYWLQPEDTVHGFFQHLNAACAYTTYLYFDFAGYSSLAVGVGNMLGIKVPQNFNFPFLAINPQDFWRRWHITLGDWLRDYFFRPIYKWLSGFKSLKNYSLSKQNAALFCTFLLMGCWNGISPHYIISGAVFGLYSVIHNTYTVECRRKDRDIVFGNAPAWLVKSISTAVMLIGVIFAIYIFSGRLKF